MKQRKLDKEYKSFMESKPTQKEEKAYLRGRIDAALKHLNKLLKTF